MGARLNGNMHPGMHRLCLGTDQAALTALCYADNDAFTRQYAGRVYDRLRPAVVYNAPTAHDGVVEAVDDEVVSTIRGLESVVDLTVKRKPGDTLVPTRDLLTSPLRVFMTSSDPDQLEADYHRIDELREAVYRIRG